MTNASKGCELVPTRKRMGCREARRASDSSSHDGGRGRKRQPKGWFFPRIVASSLDCISRLWVPVSTVVGGRRRSHAPPIVWLGSRKRFGRRVESEARGRTRAGRSSRTRSNDETSLARVDARRVKNQGLVVKGCSGSRRSRCRSRSRGLTMNGLAPCMRAIRWKASRCGSPAL